MGLPSKRRTKSSKLRRAAHFALVHPATGKCSHCGKDIRPHHACSYCGYYRGREIVNTLKKNKRLTRSARATAAKTTAK